MTNQDLLRALGTVPEKRLKLLDLAREMLDSDGQLDPAQYPARLDEVQQALKEAEGYIQWTQQVRDALRRLLDQ